MPALPPGADAGFAPSRGRELKWMLRQVNKRKRLFAPSRGRELKYVSQDSFPDSPVRPLAGAGIEILKNLLL